MNIYTLNHSRSWSSLKLTNDAVSVTLYKRPFFQYFNRCETFHFRAVRKRLLTSNPESRYRCRPDGTLPSIFGEGNYSSVKDRLKK